MWANVEMEAIAMAAEAMRVMEADLSGALVMCSKTPELICVRPTMQRNTFRRLNESDWLEGFDLSRRALIHKS